MEKEKLTREINELIIKICEYYGVLGNKQNAIFKYLKDCENALTSLLNEFDKTGKKINKNIPFDNVFNYKSDYKTLDRDFKNLEKEYEILSKEFYELEKIYEGEKDNTYSLTKENEQLKKEIEDLKSNIYNISVYAKGI